MQFSVATVAIVGTLFAESSMAWMVESFKSGCGGTAVSTGTTAGSAGEDTWCVAVASSHNIKVTGLEADNMEVWLYNNWNCNQPGAEVAHVDKDGCAVIPSDNVVEAVRVLRKK